VLRNSVSTSSAVTLIDLPESRERKYPPLVTPGTKAQAKVRPAFLRLLDYEFPLQSMTQIHISDNQELNLPREEAIDEMQKNKVCVFHLRIKGQCRSPYEHVVTGCQALAQDELSTSTMILLRDFHHPSPSSIFLLPTYLVITS
jgi:hypothetical protein